MIMGKIPTSVLLIALAIYSLNANGGCCYSPQAEKGDPVSPDLEKKVHKAVEELGYTEQVAENFKEMIRPWKCENLFHKLRSAEEEEKREKLSPTQYAEVEKEIVRQLVGTMRRELVCVDTEIEENQKYFDLALVTKEKKAQCVGYSQTFFILGTSIGLSVECINVEEDVRGPIGGVGHIACIVHLHNGKTIQVDLTLKDSISREFSFSDHYTQKGSYWKLKEKANHYRVHPTVQRLTHQHLVGVIHGSRGNANLFLGEFSKAVQDCTKAIERAPTVISAYINRGNAYYGLGKQVEALADFDKAIAIYPESVEAFYNRGTIYSDSGEVAKALSDFGNALEINPKCAEAFFNRGSLYGRLDKFAEAIADFNQAIELSPNDPYAYVRRATCHAKTGKMGEARKDFQRAIELNPELKDSIRRAADALKLDLSKEDQRE